MSNRGSKYRNTALELISTVAGFLHTLRIIYLSVQYYKNKNINAQKGSIGSPGAYTKLRNITIIALAYLV
jgi:hypothetical protein